MKTILYPPGETWPTLCRRPVSDTSSLTASVNDIIYRVRAEGDKALREFTLKFDKIAAAGLKVSEREIESAVSLVPDDLRKAIILAAENIEKFHRSQLIKEEPVITSAGVTCMRKNVPLEKVGLYIPGGSAPLFSTVLMLAIPAKIAGCEKVILCTPPGKDGKINPVILYSARLSGITEIYMVGGAQAIAAMAYGTETIPRVDKIFGPGNQFVTRAKEIVQSSGVAIDLPAGPSEVLVIADSSADPSFVAADLLSQAEHGPDSQVVLATDNEKTLRSVKDEIKSQLDKLPRKDIAAKSMNNSLFLLFNNLQDCVSFSNEYAPEHLVINTSEPWTVAGQVKNTGSVFVGRYSCESAGDYASGTNHTLPTNGYARSYSGVSTDSFIKKITFQEISSEGIRNIGPAIQVMAEAEGLEAHKNAVSIRLKSIDNV
ncbi:MAG TPA: histidinol dehydrogenase [Bacteroidales bacterium]|jgi:histidinol dehydrogenase|nr:MAG: Histidinol dehydrogenase [Bacteroidetes bacterium ADurb.Bin145]HQG63485.1 histidinol dehydrogenase [Bacteroidales bacterium]HQK69125.1 histidinol dehydrogenase [Bacteroidales bacterium]